MKRTAHDQTVMHTWGRKCKDYEGKIEAYQPHQHGQSLALPCPCRVPRQDCCTEGRSQLGTLCNYRTMTTAESVPMAASYPTTAGELGSGASCQSWERLREASICHEGYYYTFGEVHCVHVNF